MTIQDLKDKNLILLECISGSKAYGLDLPHSDTDIKGVFYLPKEQFFGSQYLSQVSDENKDTVYYELGRYIELLAKNNPTVLELLATPADKVLYKHPIMAQIQPALFLSRKCKDTFGGYAFTQIKKAKGLNKKIVNPMDRQKKTILDFCMVLKDAGSLPLKKWLDLEQIQQTDCGLVNIPHARDMYALYVGSEQQRYRGLMQKKEATSLLLSSIPKDESVSAYLYFNQDGYTKYCKDYRNYWDWVETRNEHRYQDNIDHGKNYDSKNMMHTFRLLDMAIEILRTGEILVKRPNREELLTIRRGIFSYEELIEMAKQKKQVLDQAHTHSPLQNQPEEALVEALLVEMRQSLYDSDS